MPHLARGGSRHIAGIGLGLLLAGCGGGGSDDGSSSAATVLQPHSLPDLPLSRSLTAEVAEEFLFHTDLALYFAVLGVALTEIPSGFSNEVSTASWEPVALPCPGGGTLTIERVGPGGGALAAGDSVRALYNACREVAVTLNGELRVDINSLSAEAGSQILEAQVTLAGLRASSANVSITMSAVLPVIYTGSVNEDQYMIFNGWMQIITPAGRETLTNFMVNFQQHYLSYAYWLDMSATLTSDWLNGTVHGSTGQPFQGQIGQLPTEGRFELFGAGNRSVALQTNSASGASQAITIQLIDEATGDVLDTWSGFWPGDFAEMFVPLRDEVLPPKQPGDPSPPSPPTPEPDPEPEPEIATARHIPLGAPPTDLVVDAQRRQFYVAVAERNEIVAINLDTLLIDRRILVAGRPQRLQMSLDGNTLFITANAAGSVVALNLDDDSTKRIDIVTQLNQAAAWDVVEYQPGKLLVTANSGGFSYVVNVDLETGEAERVADSRIIRSMPFLLHRPGDRFAYVSESNSPNSLRRLDLESPGIPIVLQSPHTGISGTNHMALNADGTRIVLESGQVVRTGSFATDLNLPRGGRPQFSRDFAELMVWTRPGFSPQLSDTIEIYDGATLARLDEWRSACGPATSTSTLMVATLRHLDEGRWAFLRDTEICVSDRMNPDKPPGIGDNPLPAPPAEQAVTGTHIEFTGIVHDAVVDAPGGLAYVSIPVTGEVHQISATTLSIERTLQFSGEARGLDLSADGSVLYVVVTPGAGSSGSVVRIATETGEQLSETPVHNPQSFGNPSARSVLSVAPGRMLVDAGNGFVEIHGYEDPISLSLSGTNSNTQGHMLLAPGGGSAYLGRSNVSPPSVLRINLGAAAASISAQNVHGAIGWPGRMAIAPDGNHLYLQSGQVLSTSTLMPAGRLGTGIPQLLSDGSEILVAPSPALIERYDAQHEVLTARYTTDCSNPGVSHLLSALDDSIWLVIGGDMFCAVVLPEN